MTENDMIWILIQVLCIGWIMPKLSLAAYLADYLCVFLAVLLSQLKSTPRLLSLPPEIKLQVLSHLDPKSIQTTRRVCHNFKALVDMHDNILANPLLNSEHSRLWSFFNHHAYEELSWIEAMCRWVKHKGLWYDPDMNYMSARAFSHHYYTSRMEDWYESIVDETTTLVNGFCLVHLPKHTDYTPTYDESFIADEESFISFHESQLTFDAEMLAALYDVFAKKPELLRTHMHERGQLFESGAECIRLTQSLLGDPEVPDGPCNADELAAVFDIPDVGGLPTFAYYAKDEWTAQQATKHKWGPNDSPLTALHQAAVLQGLSIH